MYAYVWDSNGEVNVFGLDTKIGDLAEGDFVSGLKKRSWDVFMEIKNKSNNGVDVIA